MHIFVTGGTGFFGRALLRHWAGGEPELAGARFTLLSRNPERFRQKHAMLLENLDVRLIAGDVQRSDSLPVAGDFTHVLHAATDSTAGLMLAPLQRFEQIVEGTRNILDLSVRTGARRVLLISSGGVYGPQAADMAAIPETWHGMPDPLEPHNAYSIGKRMAEHMAALYKDRYDLDTVVARCFTFIGQDLPVDAHFAVGNFMRDALAGRDIVVHGDGTPIRSYMDQRDLARWLTTMLLSGRPQRAYNVGSDEAISIADLAALLARLGGGRGQVRILGNETIGQAATRNRYVPDVSRARSELGLSVRYNLETAVAYAMHCLAAQAADS